MNFSKVLSTRTHATILWHIRRPFMRGYVLCICTRALREIAIAISAVHIARILTATAHECVCAQYYVVCYGRVWSCRAAFRTFCTIICAMCVLLDDDSVPPLLLLRILKGFWSFYVWFGINRILFHGLFINNSLYKLFLSKTVTGAFVSIFFFFLLFFKDIDCIIYLKLI